MKNFNLVLLSSGFKKSENINKLIRDKIENKNIMIITNATKNGSNFAAKTLEKLALEEVGAKKVDIIEIDKSNVSTIFEYDVIYVIGGDLQTLIEDFIEIKFKKYLVEF